MSFSACYCVQSRGLPHILLFHHYTSSGREPHSPSCELTHCPISSRHTHLLPTNGKGAQLFNPCKDVYSLCV